MNKAEQMSNTVDNASDAARDLSDRFSETIASARTRFVDGGAAAAKAIKDTAASTDDFVRANPWIAIGVTAGVAGAVGFLAGLMAAPKRRFW